MKWQASCPKCHKTIKWRQLNEEISCPNCNVPLRSNFRRAAFLAVMAALLSLTVLIPLSFGIAFAFFGKDTDYFDGKYVLGVLEFILFRVLFYSKFSISENTEEN